MPLDHGPTATDTRTPSGIDLAALGRQVALLSWTGAADGDLRRGFRAMLNGQPVAPPAAHCAIAHVDRQIHFLALPVAATALAGGSLDVVGIDGATLASASGARGASGRTGEIDLVGLIAELRPAERVRLCRYVLEVCPPLFKLSRDPLFVDLADDIVRTLSRRPGRLQGHSIAGPLAIFEGVVRRGLGRQMTAVSVSRHGVVRSIIAPRELHGRTTDDGVARLAIGLDRDVASLGGVLVVLGETGIACRVLPSELPTSTAYERAQRDKGFDVALRDYITDALVTADCPETPTSQTLAVLRAATAALTTTADSPSGPVTGRVDCLVSNTGGIAAIGHLDDPHDLVDALIVTRRNRPTVVDLSNLERFGDPTDPSTHAATGFVVALPPMSDAGLPAAVEIQARLRSGELLRLGSGPTHPTAAGEELALLRCAAATTARTDRLAHAIGPVVRASVERSDHVPEIVVHDIGGTLPEPRTSIVTPAGGDPALLRARFAAFALDFTLGETELLFTADDPESVEAVRTMLDGLSALYGRPVRLAVAKAPAPPTVLLTLAAQQARAPFLAVLDAYAVPTENGWLDALAGALAARPRAGLVAAQMLHADGSLVDAGLSWADAATSALGPIARLPGFPAAFPGHEAAQRADAVRRGAWFMRRSLFELVGGFDVGTLSTIGADIAFATRLGVAGFETWTLGEPRFMSFASPSNDRLQQLLAAIDTIPLAAAHHAGVATAAAPTGAHDATTAPLNAEADRETSIVVDAPVGEPAQAQKSRKRRNRKSKRAA